MFGTEVMKLVSTLGPNVEGSFSIEVPSIKEESGLNLPVITTVSHSI
jgi:hypothetical protein